MQKSSTDCPDSPRLTFRKAERLHHRNLVEALFKNGHSIYEFPLRMIWRITDKEGLDKAFRQDTPKGIAPLQMMVTVPKKKRKKAVDRVRMRRLIREAYRLNRIPLRRMVANAPGHKRLSLAFIYIHDKNADFDTIQNKIKLLLQKLCLKLNETHIDLHD